MFSIWTENEWKAAKYKDSHWWWLEGHGHLTKIDGSVVREKEELENASSSQAAEGILLVWDRWELKGWKVREMDVSICAAVSIKIMPNNLSTAKRVHLYATKPNAQ